MNLPRGKQGGINYGQKKQEGQSDTEQLIDIANYLRKKYKVNIKREIYITFDIETEKIIKIKDHVNKDDLWKDKKPIAFAKNPDLFWIDKYGMWIIEVDGAVHDRKVKKTNERNELFISNYIKLIVVNLADLKELRINIYDYIDQRIKELI